MGNSKKTIAFVIGSLTSGGAERVISTLSNELIRKYNILIITLNWVDPFYPLDPAIKVVACRQKIKRSKNPIQAFLSNLFFIKRIIYFLKTEKVDVAIGFLPSINVLTIVASKYLGIKCIISERNNPIINDAPKKKWDFFRNVLYKKADYLVVQTAPIKSFFDKLVPAQRVIILPNPIASEFSEFRQKKTDKENIILNVGRLTDQKQQDLLIKAFANINSDGWKLIIVGDGEKKVYLEKLISSLSLENKVKLIGKVNNIHDYYLKSKIFVLTSNFEGFPNVLIEAMYFGLACISTNCPTGPSELIIDNTNGFLIEMQNQPALEKKLDALIKDNKLREHFSENAPNAVIKYETEKVAGQWENLLTSLLPKP